MISINSLVMAAWRARLYCKGQPVDHVACVVGRGVHRGHSRTVLRSNGLEQSSVDFDLDVHRKQRVEQCVLARLVDEVAELVLGQLNAA